MEWFDGKVVLWGGDCLKVLASFPENSIDACVVDPPYHLSSIVKRFGGDGAAPAKSNGATGVYARSASGFMGQQWDGGAIAFDPATWELVLRVLKPGAHLVSFSGTRTYHRMVCAIEDAGFEIRDQLAWMFGSGFPKSHDVSKGIDKAAGADAAVKRMIPGADQNKDGWEKTNGRDYIPGVEIPNTPEAAQWEGWGTALKPAFEPIVLARKPLSEKTVAANVLKWGTGALNIDGCRVGTEDMSAQWNRSWSSNSGPLGARYPQSGRGRWPANVVHDGSDEVVGAFPVQKSGGVPPNRPADKSRNAYGTFGGQDFPVGVGRSEGSAARFFYSAKAGANDRIGSKHPTVKPVNLMCWLCRLVTPPGGTVLDCFAGTGTTGEAAFREGFKAILIEREAEYIADIERRMKLCLAGPDERARAIIKAKGEPDMTGTLFEE